MVNIECRQKLVSFLNGPGLKKHLIPLASAIPVSILLDIANASGIFIFLTSCISIICLAGIIGDATEQISINMGPRAGGLLNATMGNMPELFIGIFSVRAGMFSLVKASIVGSITGNMLLVLGFSILFGGMRYKFQSFDKLIARTNFGLLFLALIGFIIPTAYKELGSSTEGGVTALSLGVSIVFLIIYMLGLLFSFYTHRNVFIKSEDGVIGDERRWSTGKSVMYLILAGSALIYESGLLVISIESIKQLYGIPEVFLGIVVIPIIGNISEYTSAILMAIKNRINLSLEIAIGSGMQMALFVAPILIIVSLAAGRPMDYVFSLFELTTVACSIGLSLFIFGDGKTNWLEGVELLSAYVIVALAYFLAGC